MSIPSDKTFPLVPKLLTLWPLSWSLTYFLKTLTWTVSARAFIFHMSIPWDKKRPGIPIIFTRVTMTLEFDLLFENFNIANNFWIVKARALVFQMHTCCGKTFPWLSPIFISVTLTLELDLRFENFNIANNFWIVIARALVFHMHICCGKTFPWLPTVFTLWPWAWSFSYFFKTYHVNKNFIFSAKASIFLTNIFVIRSVC